MAAAATAAAAKDDAADCAAAAAAMVAAARRECVCAASAAAAISNKDGPVIDPCGDECLEVVVVAAAAAAAAAEAAAWTRAEPAAVGRIGRGSQPLAGEADANRGTLSKDAAGTRRIGGAERACAPLIGWAPCTHEACCRIIP